jgi:hypothetical protein
MYQFSNSNRNTSAHVQSIGPSRRMAASKSPSRAREHKARAGRGQECIDRGDLTGQSRAAVSSGCS